MKVNNNTVTKFLEKPTIDEEWINGGFFVLNKKIFKYINNKNNIWEKEPLENLSKDKQLNALKFHCIRTTKMSLVHLLQMKN